MSKKTTPSGKRPATEHDSVTSDPRERVTLPEDLESFSRLTSPKARRSAQEVPTAAPPRLRGDSADEGPEVEVTGIEDDGGAEPESEQRPFCL